MFNFTLLLVTAIAKLIGFTADNATVQKYTKAIEIALTFMTLGYIAAKYF